MKVGTVPKVTAGAAALVVLIFIGFIGVRQMTAPTVAERVYLSPWEDGTERPQNNAEGLVSQTDSVQDAANRESQSQISSEGLGPIDDFSNQDEETEVAQLVTEAEFEITPDQDLLAEISALLDDEGRSAEDVMNAYVGALRTLDVEGITSLMTGVAKEEFESVMLPLLKGEFPREMANMYNSVVRDILPPEKADEVIDAMLQLAKEMMQPMLKQMFGQVEIASSEHVGNEFHFKITVPSPEMPGAAGIEMPMMPDSLHKIRKENGVWRIYYQK